MTLTATQLITERKDGIIDRTWTAGMYLAVKQNNQIVECRQLLNFNLMTVNIRLRRQLMDYVNQLFLLSSHAFILPAFFLYSIVYPHF